MGPIVRVPRLENMTILRMDNVGIVFDDLDAAVTFFLELGLELEGKTLWKENGRTASSDSTANASISP